jgi:sugar O-acyltransferase (sialic acid O-acetyltransferase NeuD family)
MKQVLVFGAGGHAREVIDHFTQPFAAMGLCFAAHWIDAPYASMATTALLPLMTQPPAQSQSQWCLLPAVQSASLRERARDVALTRDIDLAPAAVHASAHRSDSAVIGAGSVVFPGAHLSVNVVVGLACVVHTASTLTHDCVLEDYAFVGPGATLCGNVHVGRYAFIGAGAVVLPGLRIGTGASVAAGAVVTRDVADYTAVRGVPAVGKHE